jgi:chromosome segregation ATPase
MNRLQILYKMDNLLRICDTCEIKNEVGSNSFRPLTHCAGCEVYADLREIGTQLEEGTRVKLKNFTVEEYQDLKTQGLNDKDICKKKDVTAPTLRLWKDKNLSDAPHQVKRVAKTNTPTTPEGRPQNELESVVNTQKRELEVREKAIEDLRMKLEGSITKEELDKLRNGWDEELAKEQEKTLDERAKRAAVEREYHRTQTKLINVDAELENTRDQLHQAREEAVKYGQEVELLRGLVRLYMPEVVVK